MSARGRAIKFAEKSNHSPIRGAPEQIKLLSRPLVRDAEFARRLREVACDIFSLRLTEHFFKNSRDCV
jgi:hypothetical protein